VIGHLGKAPSQTGLRRCSRGNASGKMLVQRSPCLAKVEPEGHESSNVVTGRCR
jgi:hypothetical protein